MIRLTLAYFSIRSGVNPSLVGLFCSLRHKLNNSIIKKILKFFWDLGLRIESETVFM